MNRSLKPFVLLLLCVSLSTMALALGGGGGDKNEGDNTRKIRMTPIDENSKAYGWVRITSDTLSLGANRLDGDAVFSAYFVNGNEKQRINPEPIESAGNGETKFSIRLEEPLGAQWPKLVLYEHEDKNFESTDKLKPVMEASLR